MGPRRIWWEEPSSPLSEWDAKKNSKGHPSAYKILDKVWWRCARNHSWQATARDRLRGSRCHFCANRRVDSSNNLTAKHPELSQEWDIARNTPLLPTDVVPGTHKKIWWVCEKGHSWRATVNSRATQGIGCPCCSGRNPTKDHNFAKRHPDLLGEWDYERNAAPPEAMSPKSDKKVWWKCANRHSWEATLAHRVNGTGCPKCRKAASKLELRIFAELKVLWEDATHKDMHFGFECDIFVPALNVAIEIDGSYWHKTRHTQDVQKNAKLEELGVPLIRVREAPLPKLTPNDIVYTRKSSTFSLIANSAEKLAAIGGPGSPTYAQTETFLAEEEYQTLFAARQFPKTNLASHSPLLSKEWHPTKNGYLSPEKTAYNSNSKVWWLCAEGHSWDEYVATRVNQGVKCRYCRSLAHRRPDLAAQWDQEKNGNTTPWNRGHSSTKKIWWKCNCGHSWSTMLRSRTIGHGKCPQCKRSPEMPDS